MEQKLLIATKNPAKYAEFASFLSQQSFKTVSLADVYLEDEEVEEDGETYKDNAIKKSQLFAKLSDLPTIADDSGLEIEALGGAPGVHSRRWLGHVSTDEELVNYMMHITKTLPEDNRGAFFKATIAFSLPSGQTWTMDGEIKGQIAEAPNTSLLKGYPYDAFFYLPEIGKYMHSSELTHEEQKQYNHRYIALSKMIPTIIQELQNTSV